MANIKVLRGALRAIRKYPDRHDQGGWSTSDNADAMPDYSGEETVFKTFDAKAGNGAVPPCGTTLCLAGWIAFLNAPKGAKIQHNGAVIIMPDGSQQLIADYATEIADLTYQEADALFLATEATADELGKMIDYLASDPEAGRTEIYEAAGYLTSRMPWGD